VPPAAQATAQQEAVSERDSASRIADLIQANHHVQAAALLASALDQDANDIVLMLLQRMVFRFWPLLLSDRVYAVEPCKALEKRAQACSAEQRQAAQAYLAAKYDAEGGPLWALATAYFHCFVVQHAPASEQYLRHGMTFSNSRAAAACHTQLGLCIEEGSIEYDGDRIAEAQRLYRIASDAGDLAGMTNLARLLARDDPEGIELCRRAASMHLSAAMYNYSLIADSVAVSQQYLERAARQGLSEAQYLLGYYYQNGTGGFDINEIEAITWLDSAASQGYADAAAILAMQYLYGSEAVEQDEQLAMQYLKQAADNNSSAAHYVLGTIYDQGNSVVTADREKALEEYWKAAKAGHPSARVELCQKLIHGGRSSDVAPDDLALLVEWMGQSEDAQQLQQQQQQPRDLACSVGAPLPNILTASTTGAIETQEAMHERLRTHGYVGKYYTWSSLDGGSTWEPSVPMELRADGTLAFGQHQAPAQYTPSLRTELTNAIECAIGEHRPVCDSADAEQQQSAARHITGELTLVCGASAEDAIWFEDLSQDCKLFSGWIEVHGEVRAAIRGVLEDLTSYEYRTLVPDADLVQSTISPVTSVHMQQLKDGITAFERFLVRAAINWNASSNEQRQWVRSVRNAEVASQLAVCLHQLLSKLNQDYVSQSSIEELQANLTSGTETPALVADSLLALELRTPWSAVVPLFRMYRSSWREALQRICDEPTTEIQQTLLTSIARSAPRATNAVVVTGAHNPVYRLTSCLAHNDSLRIKAQIQSTAAENLVFNINFNGATPEHPEFQMRLKRSAGDAGIITFNYGYGSSSDIVSAEGQPFPLVAEDFDLHVSIASDRTQITIAIEPLGIVYTSPVLDFIDLAQVTHVHLEAVHGRVLVRSFDHTLTRTVALLPGE
jgi:TPR repeat protein